MAPPLSPWFETLIFSSTLQYGHVNNNISLFYYSAFLKNFFFSFIQRVSQIPHETLKKAEVAAWFGKYDDAEKLYIEIDRKDLAIRMRKKLGDWFKVKDILKTW